MHLHSLYFFQWKPLLLLSVRDFKALPGNGLSATAGQSTLIGGSMKYISTVVCVPSDLMSQAEHLAEAGKTPLLFAAWRH